MLAGSQEGLAPLSGRCCPYLIFLPTHSTEASQKLGDFLGSTVGALLKLLGSILDGILDGLISLVTGVLDRLSQLVDLFGSFGEALGVLWTWLPTEVMTVLVAGVTIFVLLALLRLFLK